MRPRLKALSEQVIVIIGASSGIGLTTAEMAAEAGARVVLASRNEDDLLSAVNRIRASGGRAYHIVADVVDPDAVDAIASLAIEQFGGFDTWVNSADAGMYGKLTETPLADKRRLFDVDFWGVVHGCRTAARHLARGGGAIINIGSVASDRAAPLLGISSAAKHAVQGYTEALRMELEHDGLPISVSLVKPVYAPEEVAHAILYCATHPTRGVLVGGAARFLSALGTIAPRTMDVYLESTAFKQQQQAEKNDNVDALDQPQNDGERRGPTERFTLRRSAYTRAALSDTMRALPLMAAGALAAGVLFGLPWFGVPKQREEN